MVSRLLGSFEGEDDDKGGEVDSCAPHPPTSGNLAGKRSILSCTDAGGTRTLLVLLRLPLADPNPPVFPICLSDLELRSSFCLAVHD